MLAIATQRIMVTGGAGLLGTAVCRILRERGVPAEGIVVSRKRDDDLTVESDVACLYDNARPGLVNHLAAEVGGIGANLAHPEPFFFANMVMGLNRMEHARSRGIEKFVHAGTVCASPKHCPVPFRGNDIWEARPEETNSPHGVAKKALFVMLDRYRHVYGLCSAVIAPVNLCGPGDKFDLTTSHVIPAIVRRWEQVRTSGAPSIPCWGTGSAIREFLYVDNAAEGVARPAEVLDEPVPIHLGAGVEIAIRDLLTKVAVASISLGHGNSTTGRPSRTSMPASPRRSSGGERTVSPSDPSQTRTSPHRRNAGRS